MQVQEHTLGTQKKKKKIKEINDKFPISNAYQSKKEQTEAYITK